MTLSDELLAAFTRCSSAAEGLRPSSILAVYPAAVGVLPCDHAGAPIQTFCGHHELKQGAQFL